MSDGLSFSVVIPTCNRPAELAECLQRLAPGAQTLVSSAYEVIVSDDGVESVQRLIAERFPWAKWMCGPRRGPAANRNHGAEQARADWLVFTDDDCLPCADWLAAYAAAAKTTPTQQVLEGRTLATGSREAIDTEAPLNLTGGFLWSCNFAIRRELFHALRGFDTGFPGAAMEDVEFRTRLRERKIAHPFVPDAVVHHPWRRSKGAAFLRTYIVSVDYFVQKHPRESGLFTLRMSFRILLSNTWRNLREAVRSCRGRGSARMVGLEIYKFWLLAGRALRKPPGAQR